jgi:hypothetical protein
MLADPVTIAAASPTPALVFAVAKSDGYGSERIDTGGNGYTLVTNHAKSKNGNRHYIQIRLEKNATDPYSGLVRKQTASVAMAVSRPSFGFTDAEMIALMKALTDYRDDSEVTSARLLQFQS